MLLITHRGDTNNFSENTLEAFASAFDQGADGIECDVHVDATGTPIVVHNYLYDQSQKHPTLADVLHQFSQRGRMEVEIKSLTEQAVVAIKEVIEKYRPLDLEITSSIQPLIPIIARHFPNDQRGLIFRRWLLGDWMTPEFKNEWLVAHLKLCQATNLHLDFDQYTPAVVKAMHQAGYKAHSHLFESSREILDRATELQLDSCTVDDVLILGVASHKN